jgi:hypothetical protein
MIIYAWLLLFHVQIAVNGTPCCEVQWRAIKQAEDSMREGISVSPQTLDEVQTIANGGKDIPSNVTSAALFTLGEILRIGGNSECHNFVGGGLVCNTVVVLTP